MRDERRKGRRRTRLRRKSDCHTRRRDSKDRDSHTARRRRESSDKCKKDIAHCDKISALFGTDFKKAARITGKSSRTAHFCPTENSGQPPFPVICFYHRGTAVLLLSERTSAMEVSKAGAVLLIPVDKIRTNPNQPRKYFDPDELSSLGESIRRNGILQPLSVRAEDGDGKYELSRGAAAQSCGRIGLRPRAVHCYKCGFHAGGCLFRDRESSAA